MFCTMANGNIFQDMALLSKTEKLICEARSSKDRVLRFAYELTVIHIEAEAEIDNKTDERKFFYYLYTRNHRGLSYYYIAGEILHTSVSTLEDRRAGFKKAFRYFLDISEKLLNAFKEAALTEEDK